MECDVAPSRGVQRDHRLDVLDVVHLGVALGAGLGVDRQVEAAAVVGNGVRLDDGARFAVEAGRHADPHLGKGDHGARVQDAIAKEVVELEADAVYVPEEALLAVVQGVPLGGEHAQVLHVSPGQVRAEEDGMKG